MKFRELDFNNLQNYKTYHLKVAKNLKCELFISSQNIGFILVDTANLVDNKDSLVDNIEITLNYEYKKPVRYKLERLKHGYSLLINKNKYFKGLFSNLAKAYLDYELSGEAKEVRTGKSVKWIESKAIHTRTKDYIYA